MHINYTHLKLQLRFSKTMYWKVAQRTASEAINLDSIIVITVIAIINNERDLIK